ncbi:membrane anchor subunit of succinate dehydrogenase, Sdh4, partial [Tulasnella sp. 331]
MSSTMLFQQSSVATRLLSKQITSRPLILPARLHTSIHVKGAVASGSDPYRYIPGGPVLPGTVNEATTFPEPNRSHGSHHWAFERLLSVALLPMTASAFVMSSSPHPVVDGLLAMSLVIHSHIGFDSVVVDYLDKRKFPMLGPVVKWALRATTATVLVGVYQFNTTKVKRVAFAEGQRDNYWLADYVETCLIDDALVWYDALDEIIQRDFRLLRTAMLQHFISNVPLPAPAASSPPLQMKRWGRIRVVRHDGLAPEYCGQEQDQKWCMRCGRTSTESESLIVELCREPDPLKTKSRSLLRVVSPNGPTSNKFL